MTERNQRLKRYTASVGCGERHEIFPVWACDRAQALELARRTIENRHELWGIDYITIHDWDAIKIGRRTVLRHVYEAPAGDLAIGDRVRILRNREGESDPCVIIEILIKGKHFQAARWKAVREHGQIVVTIDAPGRYQVHELAYGWQLMPGDAP